MSLCDLLRKDIEIYVLRNKKWLLVPVFFFVQCLYIETLIFNIDYTISGTLADYYYFIYRGIDPILQTKDMTVPVFWVSNLFLGLFVTIGLYREGVRGFGIQMLVRSRSAFRWWISKCMTIVIFTVVYFVLLHATIVLFCLLKHVDLSLQLTSKVFEVIFDSDCYLRKEYIHMNSVSLLSLSCALPFMAQLTLHMLQLFFNLRIKPVMSFVIANIFILAALYTDQPLAFAGYAMLQRSSLYMDGGMSIPAGFAICICVICAAMFIGGHLFKKGDVL